MSIAQWLRLWEFDERGERQWESRSNGGAQRSDARAEERCEQRLGIKARCRTSRRLKLLRCVAQ
jgi:hypothetical protein